MAQSGFTPIQLYRSATPGAVPLAADLAPGELALNTADEKLFFENASGVVVSIDKANGTVTSVNASGGFTGLTFSGGPITSSGTLTLSGTLAAVNGGTGQSSYAVGDLLVAYTTTTLSKLADVATGNALISGGVGAAPFYGKIGLTTHVSGTLPVANGGTGTTTAFTAGSVVFAGASGVYSQDNANLFWDNTNDRLGIGTTAPAQTLQILNAGNYQLRMGGGGSINYDLGRNASNGLFYLYGNQTGFTGYVFDGVDGERMRITSAGNVGVGTSSPAGLLHVNSTSTTNAIVSGSDAARLVINGDTANSGDTGTEDASLIFETDGAYSSAVNSGLGNSGFRLGLLNGAAASTLVFVDILSGVDRERMRIDGSGNVGIGTATPAQKLDIRGGDLQVSRGAAGVAADAAINFGSNANNYIFSGNTNNIMVFATNGSERLRITNGGNVGIGTSAPGSQLHISTAGEQRLIVEGDNANGAGEDASWVEIRTDAGNTKHLIGAPQGTLNDLSIRAGGGLTSASGVASPLTFFTKNALADPQEIMRITGGGNVGIGTTAPDRKLDVQGSGSITVRSRSTDTSGATVGILAAEHGSGSSLQNRAGVGYTAIISTGAADPLILSTNNIERVRIDSSGNVGIGTSSPGTKLDVAGGILRSTASAAFNPAITVRSDGSASNWARLDFVNQNTAGEALIYLENTGSFALRNNIAGQPIRFLSEATERMRITSAGNVGINETAPDYKLDVNGTFGFTPGASVTPADNGDVVFELTDNTTLTVKAKGSDGVVRSGTITLA